jgi:hypothetical protein
MARAETVEPETETEVEPDAEPVAPETDEEEEAEQETTPEPPAAPEPEEATEGEQNRALGMALDRERKAHSNKLSKILGDRSTETMPCPLCFEGLMGFLHPGSQAELTDEARTNALAFLGAPQASALKEAEGVVECDRCAGWGQLLYPGKVEHLQQQMCPKCAGNGYVSETQTADTRLGHVLEGVQATGAVVNGANACAICGTAGMAGQPHYCQPPV